MSIWYKHNLGFLRIVSPVMVTFQKKMLQNISLIIKFVKINPLWLHSISYTAAILTSLRKRFSCSKFYAQKATF